MVKKIKVLKRDGSTEEFDPQKIARVVQAAGLEAKQAKDLADRVADWLKNSKQKSISSLKIRYRVLKELKRVNKYAAGLFEWYEKSKTRKHKNTRTLKHLARNKSNC